MFSNCAVSCSRRLRLPNYSSKIRDVSASNNRLDVATLKNHVARACTSANPLVLHATLPHFLLDAHPELAMHPGASMTAVLPWLRAPQSSHPGELHHGQSSTLRSSAPNPKPSQTAVHPAPRRPVVRVAVHVRRGDVLASAATAARRLLPNAYFARICKLLQRIFFELRVADYVFEIHTERATRNVTVAKGLTLAPRENELAELEALKSAQLFVNADPVDAFMSMATADILVLSHSSFSYLAGMLHDPGAGLVIYHPFWHEPRPDWFIASPPLLGGKQALTRIREAANATGTYSGQGTPKTKMKANAAFRAEYERLKAAVRASLAARRRATSLR